MGVFSLLLVGFFALVGCAGSIPGTPGGASPTAVASPQGGSNTPVTIQSPQPGKTKSGEQSKFSVEEEVQHPVGVPEDVLQILRQDERNRQTLSQGQSPSDIPASWFVASEIRLNDDDLPDLIVTAADPRLLGANMGPFWIFRNTPQGHKLVLNVSTHDLDVLSTRTQGHRDIRARAATANRVLTTVFRFDGSEYRTRR